MNIKSILLAAFIVLITTFTGAGTSFAQEKYNNVDSVINDTSFFEEADFNDEEVWDENAEKKARANAFDTISMQSKSILSQRRVDTGLVKKLKNDAAFAYVKTGIPKPEKEKEAKQATPLRLDKIWLYVAIAAFIIFLIWYLKENDLLLFRKKPVVTNGVIQSEEEKDIFSINFNDAIEQAIREKNYRLAIRLQYLHVLKILTDKNIIKYQPDKTNFDYLLQLKPTGYYSEFFSVTRNYEYSWYGLFNIDEEKYNQVKKSFLDFQKKINR